MKRKYLYRLAALVILVMMVPAIIFLNLLWVRSLKGLEQTNEVHYEKLLDSYISLCNNRFQELAQFAGELSVDSKEASSLLYQGAEEISNNPYQLYLATSILRKNYAINNVSKWGIYLYETRKVIRQEVAFSYEQYVYAHTDQNTPNPQLADFFAEENYGTSRILLNSMEEVGTGRNILLVGICSRIGKKNDKALIFFELSPADISDSLVIMQDSGIACYLIQESEQRVLTGWGDDIDTHEQAVLSGEASRKIAGMKQKVLYQKSSGFADFSIAVYVTGDSLQSHIVAYAYEIWKFLLAMILVLLTLGGCVIYISYKPVYELTNELGTTEGSEFDIIRGNLNSRQNKIQEQEMMILDLLLNQLIYGRHISEKKISCLGIDPAMKYYCVFLLKGYVPLNKEVKSITERMAKELSANLFMTDWEEGKDSIYILFFPKDVKEEAKEIFADWIRENGLEKYEFYTGRLAEKLDDIRGSFLSCLEQAKKREGECKKAGRETEKTKHDSLKGEILAYMEQNYRNEDLTQTEVADLFGISNYTLSRLFKNKVGIGFSEYLIAKRVQYAGELLLTSSHSVGEISAMAGFSSINHFSKTFKMYTGLSPTAYRSQN